MRDTNLYVRPSSLPEATAYHYYEGPPLVVMIRRTRRDVANMVEDTARALGLEGFRSSVREGSISSRSFYWLSRPSFALTPEILRLLVPFRRDPGATS